jgi:hypothetical protein
MAYQGLTCPGQRCRHTLASNQVTRIASALGPVSQSHVPRQSSVQAFSLQGRVTSVLAVMSTICRSTSVALHCWTIRTNQYLRERTGACRTTPYRHRRAANHSASTVSSNRQEALVRQLPTGPHPLCHSDRLLVSVSSNGVVSQMRAT